MCVALLFCQLVKDHIGNDRYVERSMNTFNNAPKLKYVQTNKISHNVSKAYRFLWHIAKLYTVAIFEQFALDPLKKWVTNTYYSGQFCTLQDVGISASTWDMYDTYKMVQEAELKGASWSEPQFI